MAHVLVFYDDSSIAALLAQICADEGHAVTRVSTVDDALMVLRSSLHPMLALCERDRSWQDPAERFFAIIRDHPQHYGQHRYIAFTTLTLTDDERALLDELGVPVLSMPCRLEQLLDLIAAIERA